MQRKGSFLPAFLIVFCLSVLILTLSLWGKLNFLSSFLGKGTAAIQSTTFGAFRKLPFVSENGKVKKLEDRNLELLSKLTDLEKIKKENAALSDQFQTSYPQAMQLLKAEIIGAPSFVPGVSVPTIFVINKGFKDSLKVGMAVIIKNNLVGVISKVAANIAEVSVVNNPLISFTAKTQNGAVGIIKGGEDLTLDNILLSETIAKEEIVLTKGSIDSNGVGIPPDLIVGKIISVEKKPSELFQKAKIESFVKFANLSTVFIYKQLE